MTVFNEIKEMTPMVVDDLQADESGVSQDKLQLLKNKLASKEKEMTIKVIDKKTRSLRLGIIGSGQAGSRIAETFYKLGYEAVAINTAPQDLEFIDLPQDNKLLLSYGVGGASKELTIGHEAAEQYKDDIYALIEGKLSGSQMLVLCFSLGGGSGAGSAETLINLLATIGKPVIVITVLPMNNDDAHAKRNALETLSKLAKEVQNKKIANLIVVDNAKIEVIYSNVSQIDFFNVSNKIIVEPIDAFNSLSAMPSFSKALDPMELTKILVDGEGLTVFGEFAVHNYEEDVAIAEAVVNNLSNNLLAEGFDLKQTKYVGVILTAPKSVWDKIPSSSINYCMSMVQDLCGVPNGIFKGMYVTQSDEDCVKVYSIFSGLGLPESRVSQLKKEVQEHSGKTKSKVEERSLSLRLDTGTDETISAADKIKQKIAAKKSTFGNFVSSSVQDKRK